MRKPVSVPSYDEIQVAANTPTASTSETTLAKCSGGIHRAVPPMVTCYCGAMVVEWDVAGCMMGINYFPLTPDLIERNQPPSGVRGDPAVPRTVNGEARDKDSSEVLSSARSIVARLIVDCEMDNLDGVVAGVRALGALFGEPEEEQDEQPGFFQEPT